MTEEFVQSRCDRPPLESALLPVVTPQRNPADSQANWGAFANDMTFGQRMSSDAHLASVTESPRRFLSIPTLRLAEKADQSVQLAGIGIKFADDLLADRRYN